ncbi:hypothetical protein LAZ67_16001960 [Cordylochernes scorpioides]|uniref:Reverse transcriptase Ty1/copia-type domain-containing protein n=1 Tax=Cordylochernes scorpioides TaxID=51811 RepID=A0ABY6LFS5_9ARAC|nr:hypothetical protein LAZ67_16001960 [Cordylochernes scorpioides]
MLFGSDEEETDNLVEELAQEFEIRISNNPEIFVGMNIIIKDEGLILSQHDYIECVLKNYNMKDAKPVTTPIVEGAVKNDDVCCSLETAHMGLIGPFRFEGTVTGINYLTMLADSIFPAIPALYGNDDFYFQLDGAPPHYHRDVRAYLDKNLSGQWIGRRGPIEFPARSPDLTPLDFFLWGTVKDGVYKRKPRNLDILWNEIQAVCREISLDVLIRCTESVNAAANIGDKNIKEIETEFHKEYPSRDSILVVFKLLEINESQLRNANSQIKELMLDDENTTMQELEKEQDLVEQYERNFLLIERKVAEYLNPKGNDQPDQGDVASIRSSPEKSTSCKLPKIALKVFDGTSLGWLGWWSQFEIIHENPSLSEVDKFHYLIQAMKVGTRAERLVKSYPLTEANYPKVIEALKECLVKYDQVESHIRSLDSLGVNVQQNSSFLYPLVESSLPEELIRVWQRSDMAGYAKDEKELIPSVDQRLTSLLAFVRREVKGEQRIA